MLENKPLTGYPSIDKPWMKYYGKDVEKKTTEPESIFQMMERCNKDRLDTIALDLRTSKTGLKRVLPLHTESI